MFRFKRFFLVIATLLLAVAFISSCTPSNAEPQVKPLTTAEVQVFADPMAENMLSAMNTGNYTAFTRDFTESLKDNLSETNFETANSARVQTVGTYVSKEFWQYTQKNEKITVGYRATFTDEPSGVTLTLYLKNVAGAWHVDGYKYDSPLMRAADC